MVSFREDPRFARANREAGASILFSAGYFVWWYAFAYGLGRGSVEDYGFVLGFPAWFFWSCIAGGAIFCALLPLFLNRIFLDVPLDDDPLGDSSEMGTQGEAFPVKPGIGRGGR